MRPVFVLSKHPTHSYILLLPLSNLTFTFYILQHQSSPDSNPTMSKYGRRKGIRVEHLIVTEKQTNTVIQLFSNSLLVINNFKARIKQIQYHLVYVAL